MSKRLTYTDLIKNNLGKQSCNIKLPSGVTGTIISPADPTGFLDVARLLIACFCRHPRRVLEEIQRTDEGGVEEIVRNLFAETLAASGCNGVSAKTVKVWRGTVGEVLATAYVIGFTEYKVPIFKLRFAPNRRISMPGDDILGFQFTSVGEPLALLVVEAKNWQDNIGGAVKEANATLLGVKDGSPTLLNFIVEQLDAQGRHDEAKIVQRFFDKYNYEYKTEYLAFVVADIKKWKDELYLTVSPRPATPLEIAAFLMGDWEDFQKSLTLNEQEESWRPTIPSLNVDDVADVQRLLDNSTFQNQHSRLASAALATSLQIEGREQIQYDLDARRLEMAARFVSTTAIRLLTSSPERSINLLYYAARIFERLAVWELERGDRENATTAIVDGAIAYSIAGYDANARVLMEAIGTIQDSMGFLAPVEKFSALTLSGRLSELEDEIAKLLLGSSQFEFTGTMTEQEWAELIGQTLAHVADLLVAKSFALLLHYLRVGKSGLVDAAIDCLNRATRTYSLVGEYKSSHLSTILTVYFSRLAENSPQALLPQYINGGSSG
jgi:hypothetical protein